jgi:hypothetical protein
MVQLLFCGRSGENLGLVTLTGDASEASYKKKALLRQKRARSRAGGGASEATKKMKALLRQKRSG